MIKEVPFKIENLVRWYLLRNSYSDKNFKEIISLWYSYNDEFKTDNIMQEVEDFMSENKDILVKRNVNKKHKLVT